ncbi:MAG: DUF2291 family protein [Janthinobacterium lividum]
MSNILKYGALVAVLGLLGFNSVYFEKLSSRKAPSGAAGKFDAVSYAQRFWADKLLPAAAQAADLAALLTALKTDPQPAFARQSHALGIGNIRYFLVRGAGTVTAVSATDVTVQLTGGPAVRLATEYVYGNAARDASGLIKNTEFDNTADLDSLAEQLNARIRQQVVPGLRAQARPGQAVQFAGAIELNQAHLHLDKLEVMPLSFSLVAP